jgi:hypothetical protein
MTDFDDVTFQEQFRFTKAEFLDILSNIQDKNGAHGFLFGQRLQMVCVLLPLYCFVSPSHSNL